MPLWVRGEVSDFKPHRNGHWYFSLAIATSQSGAWCGSATAHAFPPPPDDGNAGRRVRPAQRLCGARRDAASSSRAWRPRATASGARRSSSRARARGATASSPRRGSARAALSAHHRGRDQPRRRRAARHHRGLRRRRCRRAIVVVPAAVQGDGAPEEIMPRIDRVSRWGRRRCRDHRARRRLA